MTIVKDQMRSSGLNEEEVYKKVLEHLAEHLANAKYRSNFTNFIRIYKKQIENDIQNIHTTDDELHLSLNDLPPQENNEMEPPLAMSIGSLKRIGQKEKQEGLCWFGIWEKVF